jgi:catechol 2,3-dioxygenase-like lactoylglutathione lyase family enzyme
MSLTQIGQIAIIVTDVDRAIRFYRDTLGMRFLFQAGTLAFFDCGGVRLMLSIPEKPEFHHHASILYYRVADIEGTHDTLKTRGVAFIDEPHLIFKAPDHDLWMTFFKDSEGNTMALMSEKPRA